MFGPNPRRITVLRKIKRGTEKWRRQSEVAFTVARPGAAMLRRTRPGAAMLWLAMHG
ncbi:MAG: hypothetical protein R6U98_33500 [Pirellulaceae bacterium]